MSMVPRWGVICVVLLSGLIVCHGCSKESSFEPLFDLDPGERLRSDTLFATQSEWFNSGSSPGPAWSSTRMVVCNWKGYESRGFLRFTAFPDTSVTVDTVRLYLWANRIEGNWDGAVLDIHTLVDTLEQTELYWGEMPGISAEPIGQFNLPSGQDSVFVDVTDVLSSWIGGEGPNYGLALKPHEGAGPEFLVEFATREVAVKTIDDSTSLDFRPALRIAYTDTAGESQLAVSVATEDTFADTLLSPFPDDADRLFCGSGFPSRAFVKFEVDRIPEGSTVTKSTMRLTLDPTASSFDSIGITCHAVLAYPWEGFATDIGATGIATVTLVPDEITDNIVEMDITALVQPLVAGIEKDRGFAVKASNEAFDLDFVSFWSHLRPEVDLKPRLVVDYTLPPASPYLEVEQP